VHTDIYVNEKFGRHGDRAARLRVVRTHDPDTLRRADLGTDSAGGAKYILLSIRTFIVNQEGNVTRFFRRDQSFFRILDGEDAALIFARAVLDSFFRVVAFLPAQQPDDVVNIRIPESLPGDTQSFKNTFSVHIRLL